MILNMQILIYLKYFRDIPSDYVSDHAHSDAFCIFCLIHMAFINHCCKIINAGV